MINMTAHERTPAQRQQDIQNAIGLELQETARKKAQKTSNEAQISAINSKMTTLVDEEKNIAKQMSGLKDYMQSWRKSLNLRNPFTLQITESSEELEETDELAELILTENEDLNDEGLKLKLEALENALQECKADQAELARDKQRLNDEIDQLSEELLGIADKIQKLTLDLIAAQYDQQGIDVWLDFFNRKAEQYLTDPTSEELIAEYRNADRAMVYSEKLAPTQSMELLSCWRMINHAKKTTTIAFQNNKGNKELVERKAKYLALSKQIFAKLLSGLPTEMHLLKVLYFFGEYELINTYLVKYNELLSAHNGRIPKELYTQFIRGLAVAVNVENNKRAQERLALDLNKFPGAEALIAQQEYVQKLRALLSFVEYDENDPLRKELKALIIKFDDNINKAKLRNRAVNNVAQDLEQVKQEVKTINTRFMQYLFVNRLLAPAAATHLTALWFSGIAALPIAAYGVGRAAAEAKYLRSSKETQEAAQLAEKLEPIDFLYINNADKVMGVHTAAKTHQMDITGDSVEDVAQNQAVKLIDKLIDKAFAGGKPGYFSGRISQKLMQKAQPKINSATLAIVALFTITLTSALSSLIILTVVYPAIWPVVFTTLTASSLLGFGVAQMLAPGSTIPQKFISASTAISFNIAATLHTFSLPMRSLRANVRDRRIVATFGSLVGSIIGGAAIVIMLPLTIVPYFVAGVLGFVGSIAPITDENGEIRRRTFREILDTIYVAPVKSLQSMLGAESLVKANMFGLTADEAVYIDSIIPQLDNKKFSEVFKAYISARLDSIQKKLDKLGDNYNPAQITAIAKEANNFENEVDNVQVLMKSLLRAHQMPRPETRAEAQGKARLLATFIKQFDKFMKEEFEAERQTYVQTCAARKQNSPAQLAQVVKTKSAVMRFSSTDARVKAAEKVLGTPPQFDMEYAVNYEQERAQVERITAMYQMVSKVRPN